jgi:hypothetical protein
MNRDPLFAAPGPVLCVVGARPNFMKMAPILRAFSARSPALPSLLVHTGQHYDADMNDRLFADLRLPRPISTSKSPGHARGPDRRGDAAVRTRRRRE